LLAQAHGATGRARSPPKSVALEPFKRSCLYSNFGYGVVVWNDGSYTGGAFFSSTAQCAVPKKIKIARGWERALVRAGNL
jgi:hypothetical protein